VDNLGAGDEMADSIRKLYKTVIKARSTTRKASPDVARTAKLFDEGRIKIAKKLVEEATEVSLECVAGNRDAVINESVDMLYNWVVALADMGIKPQEIWDEMTRREEMFGIAGKLPKTRVLSTTPSGRGRRMASVSKH
jgi:phosphoribosyl-ATP pyrophosphohydrolase